MPRLSRPRRSELLDQLGITREVLHHHLFAIGQTGSGKTTILRQLLAAICDRYQPGAVHGCVKADEAELICDVVSSTRMRDRLIHLRPENFSFNFVGYELSRPGGSPASLTKLFSRLHDQLQRAKGDKEEAFWKGLFFDFMHAAATIAWYANGSLTTVEDIYDVITSCPASPEDLCTPPQGDPTDPEFQRLNNLYEDRLKSCGFLRLINQAASNVTDRHRYSEADRRDFGRAKDFFLERQLSLGDKARGAGVQATSSILGNFLRSPFYETFCVPESSFTPEVPLFQYYVVLDAPILVHQTAGQLMQSLITMMVIEAGLRQKHAESDTLIVRDEMQMLVTDPLFETMVLSVARSHRLGFISAVQNLPLMSAAFGGDPIAEQQTKALLANYGTKFVLANGCMTVTNQFFSEMFGQHRETMHSLHEQMPQDPVDFSDAVFGSQRFTFGTSQQFHPRVPPDAFLKLRKGGPPHYAVDAYMAQAGRVFPETGLPYKIVTFHQR